MPSKQETIEAEATIIEEELSPLAGAERWLAEKRAKVAAEAAQFRAYEVTDHASYRQAKKERGMLNKSVRAINAERIDMTKAITAAVSQFKADTDELTAPLTEIAKALDSECKRWEADAIARRKALLREAYEDAAPLIALPSEDAGAPLVPFDVLAERYGQGQLGKKWFLFGTNDMVARDQLMEAVAKVAEAEKTIDAMVAEEDRDTVKALYFSALDMDAAMGKARELADQRARILALDEERKAQEAEAARAAAEEQERIERLERERQERMAARGETPIDQGQAAEIDMSEVTPGNTERVYRGEPIPPAHEYVPEDAPAIYDNPSSASGHLPKLHPWVLVIPGATDSSIQQILDYAGSLGVRVSGVYDGTLAQAYLKEVTSNGR